MKLIKSITTKRFAISLFETDTGYMLSWTNGDVSYTNETVKNYDMADYMFGLKLNDLEGN